MKKFRLFTLFFCLMFLSHFQTVFSQEWQRVYFASYPRSGNHWVRYLIEEASHIATSSVYCDPDYDHMDKIFPWGGYCSDHGYTGNCRYPKKSDMVFLKTHFPAQGLKKRTKFDGLPYQSVLLLVRNPIDSFYSRYVRQNKNSLEDKVPSQDVKRFINDWLRFQAYWDKQDNVITMRYEDILENPSVELKKILAMLNYEATDEDVARAIATYPPEGQPFKNIDKFTKKDLRLISEELSESLAQFDYQIPL